MKTNILQTIFFDVVFLDINGYDTSFPREEGVKITLDVVNSNSKG